MTWKRDQPFIMPSLPCHVCSPCTTVTDWLQICSKYVQHFDSVAFMYADLTVLTSHSIKFVVIKPYFSVRNCVRVCVFQQKQFGKSSQQSRHCMMGSNTTSKSGWSCRLRSLTKVFTNHQEDMQTHSDLGMSVGWFTDGVKTMHCVKCCK